MLGKPQARLCQNVPEGARRCDRNAIGENESKCGQSYGCNQVRSLKCTSLDRKQRSGKRSGGPDEKQSLLAADQGRQQKDAKTTNPGPKQVPEIQPVDV